jgi:hypothetical protein
MNWFTANMTAMIRKEVKSRLSFRVFCN